jgi:hypothetical protein
MHPSHKKDCYPSTVIGMPGWRTRYDRSGLDYIDTQSEWAHMQGVLIRHLITRKLRISPYARNLVLVMATILCLCFFISSLAEAVRVRAIPSSMLCGIPAFMGAIFLLSNIHPEDNEPVQDAEVEQIPAQDENAVYYSGLDPTIQPSEDISPVRELHRLRRRPFPPPPKH